MMINTTNKYRGKDNGSVSVANPWVRVARWATRSNRWTWSEPTMANFPSGTVGHGPVRIV